MRRFFNADLFAATGQGFVGNNMFAYCNNNPVNGADPCGTCFHRWDFWNDCEKCGGQTIEQKFDYAVETVHVWVAETQKFANDAWNAARPHIEDICNRLSNMDWEKIEERVSDAAWKTAVSIAAASATTITRSARENPEFNYPTAVVTGVITTLSATIVAMAVEFVDVVDEEFWK